MSSDFYSTYILPFAGIIIKICRAYTNTKEDFDDYYQEVCLQIWRSHGNFNHKSEWSTWVYKLTLNVCITLFKNKKRSHQEFASDYLPETADEKYDGFGDESIKQLYQALRQLSEIDRAVILLYLEEKSYKEIAEIIGSNPNNIGVRINRIKERLNKILKKEEY